MVASVALALALARVEAPTLGALHRAQAAAAVSPVDDGVVRSPIAVGGPKRPRDVWVFRSVLDKHARMLTAALSDELWVAYDATTASLYKAWKGGVEFNGAVYTTVHGPQPTSQGRPDAEWAPGKPSWGWVEGGKGHSASVRYRGYRFDRGRLVIESDLDLGPRRLVRVSESPEYVSGPGGRAGLERRVRLQGVPQGVRVTLALAGAKKTTTTITGGRLEDEDGLVAEFPGDGESTVTTWFDRSPASLQNPPAAQQAAPREPGATYHLWEIEKAMTRLPRLVPNQTPNVSRVVPRVDFWTTKSFGGPEDQFYVEVTGFFNAPERGRYEFRLTSDDGSELTVKGKVVVLNDGLHGPEPVVGSAELAAGENPFRVRYFENAGTSALRLEWRREGSATWRVAGPDVLTTQKGEVQVTSPGKKLVLDEIDWGRPGDGRPLDGVHPSFTLTQLRPDGWKPRVGGIGTMADGRVVVCCWEPDGGVYTVEDPGKGDPKAVKVRRIAAGLAEPLGLVVVDGDVYVLQKQELTRLVDRDKDGTVDEYQCVSAGWGVTDNFHEFAFGLVYRGGRFYGALATAIDPGGRSTQPQNPDRGRVVRIDPKTGAYEFVAAGLRTPNGIGFGAGGDVYVTDNQGDWLPSSKLVVVKGGDFFGNRSVEPVAKAKTPETPPVVWLPQGEIGNSPSEPAPLDVGQWKGQMIHGDVTHGGLKRVFVEEVDGVAQGCVFRFTQGLEAGVNRIHWTPDGSLVVGGIGSAGNWGQEGKLLHGLQRLRFEAKPAFEMLEVRARSNGLEIVFTEPLGEGGLNPEDVSVRQWRYVPTIEYGGPKVDEENLAIKGVTVSADRRRAELAVDGIKPGHVVYVRLSSSLRSAGGRYLWSTEGWYTMNRVPRGRPVAATLRRDQRPGPNTLSAEERAGGFRLLFDGETTRGWKGFRRDEVPSGWSVIDGALAFTPGAGGGDISTVEEFGDFELRLDWRVAPGGNSGIMTRVSEDRGSPWETGPEMQVLDDAKHPDGRDAKSSAGSLYGLIARSAPVVEQAKVWNRVRIVARGTKVEYWLNGVKVVEYDAASAEFQRLVAASKFASMPGFAKNTRGRIVLQDHGDPVQYRNVRIRPL